MNHTFQQVLTSPSGSIADAPVTFAGDSTIEIDTTVAANGGSADVVTVSIPSAKLVSLALIATVPCVVTFTGSTGNNQTLVANVMNHITAVATDVTALSIGANTAGGGLAGTIKIRGLLNL